MEIKKCEKGHFYDAEANSACSECAAEMRMNQKLPGFLVKPNDPISQMMYGNHLTQIKDKRCGYSIEINEEYQDKIPQVRKFGSAEIDEAHIYSKEGIPSWYVVKILKTPSVKTSPLEGAVEHPYRLSKQLQAPAAIVTMPEGREIMDYESFYLKKLGAWPEYDRIKKLDESQVFVHVFRLNGRVYKDYILCARKDVYAWRIECYIESQEDSKEISPVDFVPPGFLFGGFCPFTDWWRKFTPHKIR